MKTYNLRITEHQARLLVKVLDFYMRMGLTQFEEMVDAFPHLVKNADARGMFSDRWDLKRAIKSTLNRFLAPESFGPDTSYGVCSPDLPEDVREAVDIHDVIRHRISWDRTPGGGIQTWFDTPRHFSNTPLPTIQEVSGVPAG